MVKVTPGRLDSICESRRNQRLFQRASNPQLPANRQSLYGGAKRLEYDGDLKGALTMYQQAMMSGDRADSAMKDIAGLLNMLGRPREAIDFLKDNSRYVENEAGYMNLIERLELELERESAGDMPRSVLVTLTDASLGPVSLNLCDRLFPNPAKIRRILYLDDEGCVAVVHFATHSAARKAIQVRKVVMSAKTEWASSFEESRLRAIEAKEKSCTPTECSTVESLPDHLSAFADKATLPLYASSDPLVIDVTNELLGSAVSDDLPAIRNDPYVSEITDREGNLVQAVIFPLPGVKLADLPKDPVLLTQYILASAHAVLAAQTVAATLQTMSEGSTAPHSQESMQTPRTTRHQPWGIVFNSTPSPVMDLARYS